MKIRSLFFYLLLVCFPGLVLAEQNIAGTYSVRGSNLESEKYEGFVVISKEPDGGYRFEWTLPTEHYEGRGELKDGRISVTWGAPDPVIYTVQPDGVLRGTWGRGRGSEELIP